MTTTQPVDAIVAAIDDLLDELVCCAYFGNDTRPSLAGIRAHMDGLAKDRQAAQEETETLRNKAARAGVELRRAVQSERDACALACEEYARDVWEMHASNEEQSAALCCAGRIRARTAAMAEGADRG